MPTCLWHRASDLTASEQLVWKEELSGLHVLSAARADLAMPRGKGSALIAPTHSCTRLHQYLQREQGVPSPAAPAGPSIVGGTWSQP